MPTGDQWPWNIYPPAPSQVTPTPKPRVAGASDLGKQLAAALGFGDQKVKSIDLHVAVDDIVTAKVEVIVTESQAVTIRDIFTKRVKLESKVVGEELT